MKHSKYKIEVQYSPKLTRPFFFDSVDAVAVFVGGLGNRTFSVFEHQGHTWVKKFYNMELPA